MRRRLIIVGVATILLIGGYLFGAYLRNRGEGGVYVIYRAILPDAASFESITGSTARALDASGNLIAYIGFGEGTGYGGTMLVGAVVDAQGRLLEPVVIRHNETPAWLVMVTGRFNRYVGIPVDGMITPGHDLDTITGATLTHRAVSDAVRETAHSIAITEFGLNPPQAAAMQWQFGHQEIIILVLFIIGIVIAQHKALIKFRFPFLLLTTVILGFRLNRALSISQVSSLFLGFFPPLRTSIIFYIVLAGVFLPIIFLGKNIYCTYVCPFCGLQEVLNKVSGKDIPLGKTRKWFSMLRNALLFITLMGVIITANVNIFFYEPFGIVFGRNTRVDFYLWVILFFSLGISFIFRKFWCVALCPTGAFIDLVRRLRGDLLRLIRGAGTENEEVA